MSGYVKLHRGWRDNPVLGGEYSRGDAWIWLIENAAWRPTRSRIKGATVTLERGELTFSVRFLADAWGWSKSRVDRFLSDLRAEGMIETRSKIGTLNGTDDGTTAQQKAGQGQSIIRLCNYEKYQSIDDDNRDDNRDERGTAKGTVAGTSAGRARDKEEEGKKYTLPNGNGGEPPNLAERLWSDGLAILTSKGIPEKQARSMIGKWRKLGGDAGLLTVLADCQAQAITEPIPWIEAAIRERGKPQPFRRGNAEPDNYHDWYSEDRRRREAWEAQQQGQREAEART